MSLPQDLERRGVERARVSFPMTFRIIAASDPKRVSSLERALVLDMSRNGLNFRSKKVRIGDQHISLDFSPPYPRRNVLELEIGLPRGVKVTCKAMVEWYSPIWGTNEFMVGTSFVDITPADLTMLEPYLSSGRPIVMP